ncbi:MAG: EAL domain-containing protein [Granulosicoccus sp.]
MANNGSADPLTDLLIREDFLREVRQTLEQLSVGARRGSLLILRCSALSETSCCKTADADDALRHLLTAIKRRSRSKDLLGRTSKVSICLFLKQCREADALAVAEQYARMLGDIEVSVDGGAPRRMQLHYRIVPLDSMGDRRRQGLSGTTALGRAKGSAGPKGQSARTSPEAVDLPTVKSRRSAELVSVHTDQKHEIPRVRRLHGGEFIPASGGISMRLRPGRLINRKAFVCCYRLQRRAVSEKSLKLSESSVFASVLTALSMKESSGRQAIMRPTIQSQLILPVQAQQISDDFCDWVSERCTQMRVSPADICLSLGMESLEAHMRKIAPMLRKLNRSGIRLMIEDVDLALRFQSMHKLARFDYLYISGRLLHDSLNDSHQKHELETLIAFAMRQQCEIYAAGLDTQSLVDYAMSIGVEIGFGRACGKSIAFPDEAIVCA